MSTTPNPTNDQILQDNGVQAPVQQPSDQPPTGEPPQLQREFVKQVGGSVYKGKTQAELIEELAKAKEHQDAELARLHQLEKQWKTNQPAQTEPPKNEFDQNRYWELMGQNPLEAQKYARDFDPDYRQTRQELEEIRTQRTIDAFKAKHEDLPLDDASVTKFEEIYNKFNLPLSVDNLELVWGYAKSNGILKPVTQQATTTQTPPPPPTLDGSITGGDNPIDPNTMPLDQLEAMLRRGGQ